MKIRICLKDPDTMHDAVERAVTADTKETCIGVSEAERVGISRERASDIQTEISRRWMRHGEYLQFDVDTDTWTATILPAKELR